MEVEDSERTFREIENNKKKKFSIFKKDKENIQRNLTDDEVSHPDDSIQRQKSFSRGNKCEKNLLVRSKTIKTKKKGNLPEIEQESSDHENSYDVSGESSTGSSRKPLRRIATITNLGKELEESLSDSDKKIRRVINKKTTQASQWLSQKRDPNSSLDISKSNSSPLDKSILPLPIENSLLISLTAEALPSKAPFVPYRPRWINSSMQSKIQSGDDFPDELIEELDAVLEDILVESHKIDTKND